MCIIHNIIQSDSPDSRYAHPPFVSLDNEYIQILIFGIFKGVL